MTVMFLFIFGVKSFQNAIKYTVQIKRTPGGPPLTHFPGRGRGKGARGRGKEGPPGVLFI